MADLSDCRKYASCAWRNSVGNCQEGCNHFKHKDEAIVVRCRDCKHFLSKEGFSYMDGFCRCSNTIIGKKADGYCNVGERRGT